MATGPGTLVDAGFIDTSGKITPEAKYKFIQDVKKELESGGSGPFPCGAKFAGYTAAKDLKLEDEKKFPDFHKTSFDTYEKIAQSLNMPGNFSVLPICDPLALGAKLGLDLKVKIDFAKGDFVKFMVPDPKELAAAFGFTTPPDIAKFVTKFTAVLVPTPPSISIPKPPAAPVPGVTVKFDAQLAQVQVFTQLPGIVVGAVTSFLDPGLLLKFAKGDIPGVMGDLCKSVHKAFETPSKGPPGGNQLQLAFTNVMARWTTAMIGSTAIGEVVGTSPQGMSAQPGILMGTKDPIPAEEPPPSPPTPATTSSEFIKKFALMHEGRTSKVYLDSAGVPIPTIGIGHAIMQITRDTLGFWPKSSSPPLTLAQINALYDANVKAFTADINKNITVPLNQNQYDALMDLVWNVGPSAVQGDLKKLLNSNQFEAAADMIGGDTWSRKQGTTTFSPQLKRLRTIEAELFRTPPDVDLEINYEGFYLKGGNGVVKAFHVPVIAKGSPGWAYYDENENVPPGP